MDISFSIFDYWGRYGNGDLNDSSLFKALEKLPSPRKEGPWLAGGAVRRFLQGKELDSDFDFFFKTEEQRKSFEANFKATDVVSKNDFNTTYLVDGLKVQAIHIKYFNDVSNLLNSFDFSLCKFVFDGSRIHAGQWALWDVANNKLVPENITYATSSLRRVLKYTSQGYTVCNGGLATILQQVINDPSIVQQDIEYID